MKVKYFIALPMLLTFLLMGFLSCSDKELIKILGNSNGKQALATDCPLDFYDNPQVKNYASLGIAVEIDCENWGKIYSTQNYQREPFMQTKLHDLKVLFPEFQELTTKPKKIVFSKILGLRSAEKFFVTLDMQTNPVGGSRRDFLRNEIELIKFSSMHLQDAIQISTVYNRYTNYLDSFNKSLVALIFNKETLALRLAELLPFKEQIINLSDFYKTLSFVIRNSSVNALPDRVIDLDSENRFFTVLSTSLSTSISNGNASSYQAQLDLAEQFKERFANLPINSIKNIKSRYVQNSDLSINIENTQQVLDVGFSLASDATYLDLISGLVVIQGEAAKVRVTRTLPNPDKIILSISLSQPWDANYEGLKNCINSLLGSELVSKECD